MLKAWDEKRQSEAVILCLAGSRIKICAYLTENCS